MIKTLSKSIRQYKKKSIIAVLMLAFEVVLEVFIPFFMASLIDEGIEKGNMDAILQIGGLITLICLFTLTTGAWSGRMAAQASTGFGANLRADLFHKIQEFSFFNIDKFQTASIITRLTTDITNIQMSYQMMIRVAIRCPVILVTAIILSSRINSELSMIFLFALPFLTIALGLVIKFALPIFQKVFEGYDKLNLVVQENLRGIRVVKVFVREKHEEEKFAKNSKEIYNLYTKAERLVSFTMPSMQLTAYACMIFIAWFGGKMIVLSGGTDLSTGELMSLITYTMQILMSLMMLSMVFVMLTISKASAQRAVEILSEESTITEKENCVKTVKDGSVKFENVSFSYSDDENRMALKNVDFEIKSGETVGIIGGTGSSKSTLISLIPRLYDVTSGKVLISGIDVRDYDLEVLRDSVAVVLQKNELFSGTIKENLRWGNENASDEELVEACKNACAHEFIEGFPDKYDTHIEQGGSNVSGGQKQRICIARALLKQPKILILDDSTSAVDTFTDSKIRQTFREKIADTTKIIIAQRVSSIQDASKIIVMDKGAISDMGSHEELLSRSEIYREVYESQVKGVVGDE